MEADPVGAKQTPPVERAPNGVSDDGQRYWGADTRYYDPSKIRVPVLLVHAEWDVAAPAYMSQTVYARLTGFPSSGVRWRAPTQYGRKRSTLHT